MLCLVRTKSCKRCGGDLSLEMYRYGTYLECIQCGAAWTESDLMQPDTNATKQNTPLQTAKIAGIYR